MSSTTSHPPGSVIVVDDPEGYVVPGPGVVIVGKGAVVMTMGPAMELVRVPRDESEFLKPIRKAVRDQEPKLHKRKPKQHLKGLRP